MVKLPIEALPAVAVEVELPFQVFWAEMIWAVKRTKASETNSFCMTGKLFWLKNYVIDMAPKPRGMHSKKILGECLPYLRWLFCNGKVQVDLGRAGYFGMTFTGSNTAFYRKVFFPLPARQIGKTQISLEMPQLLNGH